MLDIIRGILLGVFVIICILLILIILLQSHRSSGMGIFGGAGTQSTFGASTYDILTKITAYLSFGFIAIALVLAYIESIKHHKIETPSTPSSPQETLPTLPPSSNQTP